MIFLHVRNQNEILTKVEKAWYCRMSLKKTKKISVWKIIDRTSLVLLDKSRGIYDLTYF